MFVPAHWSEEELDLPNISLDEENYRIPPTQRRTEDTMISYMFRYKGIVPLAESIVRYNGLFPHEKVICLRIDDNKFIVLEGNRRIAALKLLSKPTQFLASPADISRLPKIKPGLRDQLSRVPALVVDSRSVADSAIAGTHIYGHKIGWSDRAKMQFAANKITDGVPLTEIATELAMDISEVLGWEVRNRIFEYTIALNQWSPAHRDLFWDERLKLEPFFQKVVNRKITSHFGAPFFLNNGSPNTGVQHLEKYVFVMARDALIAQIDSSVGRKLKLSDDLSAYLRDRFGKPIIATESHKPTLVTDLLTDPDLLTLGFTPVAKNDVAISEGGDVNINPESRKSDYSFFRKLDCIRKDDERLCQLCRELRGLCAYTGTSDQLNLEKYRLSFSFLIRATLERCLRYHIIKIGVYKDFQSKSDKKRRFSIEDYLRYFSENGGTLKLEVELIDKIKNIRSDQGLINDLHWNIHNDYGPKTINRLSEISDKTRPIIEYFTSTHTY